MKKVLSLVVVVVLILSFSVGDVTQSLAASKVKMSKTSMKLYVAQTASLKVKGTKKKVKWSSNNKSIASVSGGKVTAKKAGNAVITAKVGKKTCKCNVTVLDNIWNADVSEYPENREYTKNGDGWYETVCKSVKYKADGSMDVEIFFINDTVNTTVTRLSDINMSLSYIDESGKTTCLAKNVYFNGFGVGPIPAGKYDVITLTVRKQDLNSKAIALGGGTMHLLFDYKIN